MGLVVAEFGCGLCRVGKECKYLQLGQDGEDVWSITRRWHLRHATATMLVLELLALFGSSSNLELLPLELEIVEMFKSKSSFWALGHLQLFFDEFLFM